MNIRNIAGLWSDDITFCQETCDWKSCPRNQMNIRDRTIPHSFSVNRPADCPKEQSMEGSYEKTTGGEVEMSEIRPKKRKVEFIESYWTGGEFGSDYQWNDNHGELIRCKDCHFYLGKGFCNRSGIHLEVNDDWFCADGERRKTDA